VDDPAAVGRVVHHSGALVVSGAAPPAFDFSSRSLFDGLRARHSASPLGLGSRALPFLVIHLGHVTRITPDAIEFSLSR
jgi:hypothetical protein